MSEGDYTKDREKFLDNKCVGELIEEIKTRRRHEGGYEQGCFVDRYWTKKLMLKVDS